MARAFAREGAKVFLFRENARTAEGPREGHRARERVRREVGNAAALIASDYASGMPGSIADITGGMTT
jgi:enoyl-[acyl-carrier-protein] reductase (NADH)